MSVLSVSAKYISGTTEMASSLKSRESVRRIKPIPQLIKRKALESKVSQKLKQNCTGLVERGRQSTKRKKKRKKGSRFWTPESRIYIFDDSIWRKSRPFILAFSNQRRPELSGKVMQSGLRQNIVNLKCTLQFFSNKNLFKRKKTWRIYSSLSSFDWRLKKGKQLLIWGYQLPVFYAVIESMARIRSFVRLTACCFKLILLIFTLPILGK